MFGGGGHYIEIYNFLEFDKPNIFGTSSKNILVNHHGPCAIE